MKHTTAQRCVSRVAAALVSQDTAVPTLLLVAKDTDRYK